jgi:hypothetical protein
MTDASHLSSISLIVASGVDFFVGITAAGLALGALLVAAGDEAFVAAGELSVLAAGEAVFSVVTETLGSCVVVSVFSETVASGEAAGVEVSS